MSEPAVEPPTLPTPTPAPGDLGWLGYPGDQSLVGDKDFDD